MRYSIAANTGPARAGTMSIAGQTVTIVQAGALGCSYVVDSLNENIGGRGGSGNVKVKAPRGCTWSAVSNVTWITLNDGSSGEGNGKVKYEVAANPGAAPRTGTLTVAGLTVTVKQEGR